MYDSEPKVDELVAKTKERQLFKENIKNKNLINEQKN